MILPPKFKASTVLGLNLAEGPYCVGRGQYQYSIYYAIFSIVHYLFRLSNSTPYESSTMQITCRSSVQVGSTSVLIEFTDRAVARALIEGGGVHSYIQVLPD